MKMSIRIAVMIAAVALLTGAVSAHQGQPPAGSGFLGGKFAPINDDVATELGIDVQDGVVMVEVIDGSPAEKAGLKEKDILKKIDGKAIDGVDTFRAIMGATKPGQPLKLSIVRDKQEQEIEVTLGERPKNMQPPATRPG
jgi:serine protease Do